MTDDRRGDPRFHALLEQIGALHERKMQDYGAVGDPFANVRASEDFGVAGWTGCAIRMNDKMRRLMTASKKGKDALENESLRDSFLDLAVYSLIGAILLDEEEAKNTGTASFPRDGDMDTHVVTTSYEAIMEHDED